MSMKEKSWVLVAVECGSFEDPVRVLIDSVEVQSNASKIAVFSATPQLLRSVLHEKEPQGVRVVVDRLDLEAVASAVIEHGVPGIGRLLLRLLNDSESLEGSGQELVS